MLSSLYGLPTVTLCPTLPASLPVCLLSLPVSTIPLSTLEWAPSFGGTFSSCFIVPRKSRTLWSSNVSKTSSKNKSLLRKKRSMQQKCTLHQALILGWEVQATLHLQQIGKNILAFMIHHLITLTLNVIDCEFCGHLTHSPTLCSARSSSDHCLSDLPTPDPSVSCYSTDGYAIQANQMTKWYFSFCVGTKCYKACYNVGSTPSARNIPFSHAYKKKGRLTYEEKGLASKKITDVPIQTVLIMRLHFQMYFFYSLTVSAMEGQSLFVYASPKSCRSQHFVVTVGSTVALHFSLFVCRIISIFPNFPSKQGLAVVCPFIKAKKLALIFLMCLQLDCFSTWLLRWSKRCHAGNETNDIKPARILAKYGIRAIYRI